MSPLDAWMPHVLTAQPAILSWLGSRGHDEASAHDVWHGTLEQVLAAGTRPRDEDGASPRAYLWTAARHEAYRQERRRLPEELGDAALGRAFEGRTPLEACLVAETRGQVRAAVETLPRRFRAVVVHRYFEGLSPAEVARALSIPINTVSSRTHRALRMLGRRLDAGANALVVLVLSLGLLATSLRLERPLGEPRVAAATGLDRHSSEGAGIGSSHLGPQVGPQAEPLGSGFPYADEYHWVHQPHPEI